MSNEYGVLIDKNGCVMWLITVSRELQRRQIRVQNQTLRTENGEWKWDRKEEMIKMLKYYYMRMVKKERRKGWVCIVRA